MKVVRLAVIKRFFIPLWGILLSGVLLIGPLVTEKSWDRDLWGPASFPEEVVMVSHFVLSTVMLVGFIWLFVDSILRYRKAARRRH